MNVLQLNRATRVWVTSLEIRQIPGSKHNAPGYRQQILGMQGGWVWRSMEIVSRFSTSMLMG